MRAQFDSLAFVKNHSSLSKKKDSAVIQKMESTFSWLNGTDAFSAGEKIIKAVVNSKIIRGIAHPPGEPDSYNGLKFTKKELSEKYMSIPGTIVYDNHDLGRPIGKVIASSIGDDGSLCLDVMLNDAKYPHAQEIMDRVLSGDYRGMSLGCRHEYNQESGRVYSSNVTELSLCPQGDMPNTEIYTMASETSGLGKPFQVSWLDLETPPTDKSHFSSNPMSGDSIFTKDNSPFSWMGGPSTQKESLPGSVVCGGASGKDKTPFEDRIDPQLYKKEEVSEETQNNKQEQGTDMTTQIPTTTPLQTSDLGKSPQDPYFRNAFGQFASPPFKNLPKNCSLPAAANISSSLKVPSLGGVPNLPHQMETPTETAPATPEAEQTEHAQQPAIPGEETSSGKAAVEMKEYEALLAMKAQFEATQKKAQELELELEAKNKSLSEWENIGAELGGSSDPASSQAQLDKLKTKEIQKFTDKLKEILPGVEAIYNETADMQKGWMKPIMDTFRGFVANPDLLREPKALENTRGLVEMMTAASRNSNTRFSKQEAEIKELQRTHALRAQEDENQKKAAEESSRQASLRSQSGTVKTIDPTRLPGTKTNFEPRRSTPGIPDFQAFYSATSVSPIGRGEKRKEISTTASSSDIGFNPGYNPQHSAVKQVTVIKDGKEVIIDVATWDLSKGNYSRHGDNLAGNQTFAWLHDGIMSGAFLNRGQNSHELSAGAPYKKTRDVSYETYGGRRAAYTPWAQ